MTPAVGSIFWSTSSDHVAWVESVSSDGSTITTEDYNSGYPTNPGWWAEHTGVSTSSASGYIHFKDISNPLRIGDLTTSGTYLVKESALDTSWHTEYTGASQGVQSGGLTGVVAGGAFYVKQGNLDGSWTTEQSSGAVQASLSDASGSTLMLIGVVMSDGRFLVKQGGLSTGWTTEEPTGSGAIAGYVSGSNIGVLLSNGTFLVKNTLTGPWTTEEPSGSGTTQGVLSGSLIGAVVGGTFLVKNTLTGPWTTEEYNVAAGYLSDATSNTPMRIGALTNSWVFEVKEGGLSALWNTENTNVSQAAISGNLIGVVVSGTYYVKQGALNALWDTENTGVAASVLWSN